MEILDIYDRNKRPTGRTILRGKHLKDGEYNLTVHIWLYNRYGQLLIQKRAKNKSYARMWAATGGAALAGETSCQAALRETKEELGISLSAQEGTLFRELQVTRPYFSRLVDVWLFPTQVQESELVLQHSEVSQAKWVTLFQLENMIHEGSFVNTYPYLQELMNYFRTQTWEH